MISIGIDISGGDFAPTAALKGCLMALPKLHSGTQLFLLGTQESADSEMGQELLQNSNCQWVEASQVISMGDHPVQAIQGKPNSPVVLGLSMMEAGTLQGFASAGNSGALMVGALHLLKPIAGIIRPCVAVSLPKLGGGFNVLLDVGINVDAKPELFAQFARLGAVYAKKVHQIENPKIALLNTGAEASKGSLLYQKANALLFEKSEIDFVGNIEARDLYQNNVDVTVCDGQLGNVVLKQAEGFYQLLRARGISDEYFDTFDYEEYGGTPILGIRGNVLLGHGASGPKAFSNMILQTEKTAQVKLSHHIENAFLN